MPPLPTLPTQPTQHMGPSGPGFQERRLYETAQPGGELGFLSGLILGIKPPNIVKVSKQNSFLVFKMIIITMTMVLTFLQIIGSILKFQEVGRNWGCYRLRRCPNSGCWKINRQPFQRQRLSTRGHVMYHLFSHTVAQADEHRSHHFQSALWLVVLTVSIKV